MNLKPLGKKVIVERLENNKTTSGGIILTRSEDADKAKVIAIGSEVDSVAVDDVVLLNWNAAIKTLNDCYVISIDDIVFIYGE
jgi:co-chaperonin GroES (HSP10)